jgi:hypothetical protein
MGRLHESSTPALAWCLCALREVGQPRLHSSLRCTLEGSPDVFAGSLLVEAGAQVARPASVQSAWSGLLRQRPGIPTGGTSGDREGALSPQPRARLPDETS